MRPLHEPGHTNAITDDAAHMAWYCMRQKHVHAISFSADKQLQIMDCHVHQLQNGQ